MPSQGWQITRKHAQLSKEELARLIGAGSGPEVLEGSEVHTEHSDVKVGLAGALGLNHGSNCPRSS